MPYINIRLRHKIPGYLREIMAYYPDVLLFQLNQIQYDHLWSQLISAKYLYTDGYEIKATSWFMYALQTIKGWLGFENYCNPEKVSYTLNKLAYYGYTKQFHQPDFSLLLQYPLSSEIGALVTHDYNSSTTSQLQSELIKEYFKVDPHLNAFHRLDEHHRFGESWVKIAAYELIPQLDPQNINLITEVIRVLEQQNRSPPDIVFLPGSKYAQIAAQYYYNKAKNTPLPSFVMRLLWSDPRPELLNKALLYDPQIAKKDAQRFIAHHLAQQEYQSAFNLIDLLKDSQLILNCLLAIPETERHTLIQKNTPIAAIMAKYYLERKQYPLAQQIYDALEEINPEAAFSIAIQEKNYVKAYDLFNQYETKVVFPMSERQHLAGVFFDIAERKYEMARTYRAKKEWQKALQNYHFSLVQKKAAHHLNPSKKYLAEVYCHKRLYANALIDADLDLCDPEQSNIAAIEKAIALLRECHSTNEEEHKNTIALANGLMRRIDTLREKISFPSPPIDNARLNAHKNAHQQSITIFIKTLRELIILLEGSNEQELRLKRGKAHYLLADVHSYFNINAPDINHHYQMAMHAVPENPFYILRVTELFEIERNKLRPIAINYLKNMGYTAIDYLHWFDERWVKRDHIIWDVKDIHQPPIATPEISRWHFGF